MVDQISSNRYGKRWVRPLASFDRVPFNRWTMTTHRILALVFILVWYGIGLRWIWLYRHGGPFDVDESWYLSMAAEAAHKGGFGVITTLPQRQGLLRRCSRYLGFILSLVCLCRSVRGRLHSF
jgi:hypothetical protein